MILLLLASLLLSAAGASFISRYGQKLGLIDTPNVRSSHFVPTPKGGGIGILASFLLVSAVTRQPINIWFPAGVISLLGLCDDRFEMSARIRLVVQFLCAFITVLTTFTNPSATSISFILLPVWLIFIIGSANFYNFMDGINGIAGLTGVIGFGLMSFFLLTDGYPPALVLLAASISFSCVGFLPFNIVRPKLFMGDSGSVLLGFIFAVLVFHISSTPMDFLCYASLLFPFYIDELSTMLIRLKNNEKLTQPHRKHLYQIFANELGIPHWQVSCGYSLLQLILAVCVFSLRSQGIISVLLFLFFSSLGFILFSRFIRFKAANIIRQ